jgi:hypothetical protein
LVDAMRGRWFGKYGWAVAPRVRALSIPRRFLSAIRSSVIREEADDTETWKPIKTLPELFPVFSCCQNTPTSPAALDVSTSGRTMIHSITLKFRSETELRAVLEYRESRAT